MRATLCTLTLALAFTLATLAGAAPAWHPPLYLGNDGLWHQRIAVEVTNQGAEAVQGEPVAVPIGTRPGEANLIGAAAEAVRVCDAAGTEMLFELTDPTGTSLRRGPLPAGGRLILPAECAARATAAYYVYFDNPAAWQVPDFLAAADGVRNGGVEEGTGETPAGWRHDAEDETHRALWSTENPHSGKRVLKTVVAAGAEPTWIATRQGGIHISGGSRYRLVAWVKADNVKGSVGWYIHVGNEKQPMLISPMPVAGEGTYDWREVTAEFTAPAAANRADLGTVLRGTGTAWFDDVTLERLGESSLTATAAAPERLQLTVTGADAPWFDDNPADDHQWDYRVPVRVLNLSDEPLADVLVATDVSALAARLRGRLNPASPRVTQDGRLLAHYRLGDRLLFEAGVAPHTAATYYVYLATDPAITAAPGGDYAALMDSPRNLCRNPSFEQGDKLPTDWPGGAEGERPAGSEMGLTTPGLFGARAARIVVPHGANRAWLGWRQNVPVRPGRTYLYAAWLKTADIRDSAQLHAHYRNQKGELCESLKYTGIGPAITGTSDWTLRAATFEMPPDIASFQLHLTILATGTVFHDGVLLTEVAPGTVGRLQARSSAGPAGLVAWPVNAVVKVFPDDAPPRTVYSGAGAAAAAPAPVRLYAARNEDEPLQLAVRSPRALTDVRVEVTPPTTAGGERLGAPAVGVVGYVPIDYKTSYYSTDSPAWHRKFPTGAGASDGWAGLWPDPILPRDRCDLAADTTQPVWVTVRVPAAATPGDYRGTVTLRAADTSVTIPYELHVWGFALPAEGHLKAIYDVRQSGERWRVPGRSTRETREQFWRFMAERRTCPDRVTPDPVLRYENGKVSADFTEFDQAAALYFDTLRLPHSYTPGLFYCFGWGFPPRAIGGEQPYEGTYPFDGADRSVLRPAYRKAYQALLRTYWNHLKEKGWDRKVTLYISDEPYDHNAPIIKQMQALCQMIREVDPAIPIYSSTWRHIPAWNGALSVWGIGSYGCVPVDVIRERQAAGDTIWWTTDGQMCTDTPYCGIERLLPYYCFKYDVRAYEFWGIDWLTYDPYEFGWHSYIFQSGEPGKSTWVRYPNGDGFLAYPGAPVGQAGAVSSVRLEQAREGMEDYEYLYLLCEAVVVAKVAGKATGDAERALQQAQALVEIPNAGGRYSTSILPDPEALVAARLAVCRALEALGR